MLTRQKVFFLHVGTSQRCSFILFSFMTNVATIIIIIMNKFFPLFHFRFPACLSRAIFVVFQFQVSLHFRDLIRDWRLKLKFFKSLRYSNPGRLDTVRTFFLQTTAPPYQTKSSSLYFLYLLLHLVPFFSLKIPICETFLFNFL